jgi:hypothetical protein
MKGWNGKAKIEMRRDEMERIGIGWDGMPSHSILSFITRLFNFIHFLAPLTEFVLRHSSSNPNWNRMGWDGMGWDGVEWDEMGWGRVEWNGMEWDGVPSHSTPSHSIPFHSTLPHPISSHSTPSHPIPSHPILVEAQTQSTEPGNVWSWRVV